MRCCKLLSVYLLIVCVIKCTAMTSDELEDFRNFLKRTSQLDENVKTADPEDESEDPVSDHAWEESGKFEGDLILNEKQRRLIVENVAEGLSRNGLKDSTKRWPNNEVIYFIQREHFSADQVDAIQSGIDDLAQASCVKFRPYRKGDRDAVVIQGARRGCFSQVGYQGGYQVLNLSQRHPVGRGCFRHGTVVHELLHALGFYHMQSSPDRDDYVNVVWENIREPAKHNFRKYNTFSVSDFGVGYDYESVLHYSRRAFSSNGRDTLVPKMSGAQIGQRVGLSQKDTDKLNRMYCDAASDEVEETTKRTKKKKPKNQPFQGHGIGYHQGKTVVIQLPDAKTYKLPDVPSYKVFDYFSKSPKTLQPTIVQRFGVGKEIELEHTSPTFLTASPNDYVTSDLKNIHKDTILTNNKKEIKSSDNSANDKFEEPFVISTASHNQSEPLNEEIDRLSEILKTHVYRSHAPDFSTYKIHNDYTEFYKPNINLESESEKLDKLFESSLPYNNPTETRFFNEATEQHNGTNLQKNANAVVLDDKNEEHLGKTLSTFLAQTPNKTSWSDEVDLHDHFFANHEQNTNFSNLYLPLEKEWQLEGYNLFETETPEEDWFPYKLSKNEIEKSKYFAPPLPLSDNYWNKLKNLEQEVAESSDEQIGLIKDGTLEIKGNLEAIPISTINSSHMFEIKEYKNAPLNTDYMQSNNSLTNNQVLLLTQNMTEDRNTEKQSNLSEALLKEDAIKQKVNGDYEEKTENDYEDYNNYKKHLLDRLSEIKNGYIDFEDDYVHSPISQESPASFEQNDSE